MKFNIGDKIIDNEAWRHSEIEIGTIFSIETRNYAYKIWFDHNIHKIDIEITDESFRLAHKAEIVIYEV